MLSGILTSTRGRVARRITCSLSVDVRGISFLLEYAVPCGRYTYEKMSRRTGKESNAMISARKKGSLVNARSTELDQNSKDFTYSGKFAFEDTSIQSNIKMQRHGNFSMAIWTSFR